MSGKTVKRAFAYSSFAFVALSCLCVLTLRRELFAARLITAEIRLDGKVLLEGTTGDSGKPDADEVWRSLSTIRFRPTEKGTKRIAEANANAERRMLQGKVTVYIAYGGILDIEQFEIMRTPNKDGNIDWKVDPADVKKMFLWRSIPRASVSQLKNINAKD